MDTIRKLHMSKQIMWLVGGAFLLLTLFGGLLFAGAPKPKTSVKQGKIQEIILQNDQAKLRIQRNGVVEISTKDRTVFQFWDQERIDRLFSLLEKTDWKGFASRLKPGQKGYLLTLKTADGEITVAIAEDDSLIPTVVKELIKILNEVVEQIGGGASPSPSLLPLASPTPGVSATPKPSIAPSPTPTPNQSAGPSVTPTPTPPPVGGSQQQLFACQYTGTTAKRRILSETICDLVE